jgi:Arc/MetJ-type ribon-helix-helix transcriptional regulator
MRTSKVLSVSLPPEMHSWAEEVARSENRTMSELIRESLRAYKAVRLRNETEQQPKSKFSNRGVQRSK